MQQPVRRDELGLFLNSFQLTGAGVEVGVFRGDFAETLLSTWHGSTLHLIDPFKHIPRGYKDGSNVSDEEHAGNLALLQKRLIEHADRYVLHREFSVPASHRFADGSLDFVYIDANHAYEFICADLHAWYPKVASGGILAGHDYVDLDADWGRFDVKRAVDEFATDNNYEIGLTSDDAPQHFPSWYLRKR